MKRLIHELKDLEELIIKCMKCGMCQSVCPLYNENFFEGSVARGKISLIESLYEGNIKDVKNTLKILDYCILCGRCEKNCPSGVNTVEIFLKAKSTLRKIKKLPVYQKAILELALSHPSLLTKVSPMLHKGFKVTTKEVKDDIYHVNLKLLGNRYIKGVKKTFFTSTYGGTHYAKDEQLKVIFYPGCAINMIYVDWGEKIVKLLNRLGVTVIVPETNYCCGIPAATMGKLDIMKELLSINYDFFDAHDVKYVVTSCPTCNHTLDSLNSVADLSKPDVKFIDIIIFIKQVLNIDINAHIKEKISLHIPCHYESGHVSILTDVISKISKDFVELENKDCCGFGGTFNLKHYKDSLSLSLKKAEEVEKKGIKMVFTPCPGCVMNLTDAVMHRNLKCKVLHPVEILYEAIEGDVSKNQAQTH